MALQWWENTPAPTNISDLDEIIASDPKARGLWAKVAAPLRTMRDAFQQLADNEQARWEAVVALEADTTRSAAYRAEQSAQIASNALQRIDTIKDAAFAARDTALAAIEQSVKNAKNGPDAQANMQQAVLDEMQTQAAWARIKPVLERVERLEGRSSYDTILNMAKEAVTQGDYATMRALQREVVPYLEGMRDVHDPSFKALLDMTIAPLVSSVERAAVIIKADIQRGMTRLTGTVKMYQNYANIPGFPRINSMPGWGDQEEIALVP